MRRKSKFASGGSTDRSKARLDRKVADIESDYQKALKAGKNTDVARAKYNQRMADARDDYQKWTGGSRELTRAGEREAEASLSAARKGKQTPQDTRRTTVTATTAEIKRPDTSAISVTKGPSAEPSSFSEAFRAARKDKGAGQTFTWKGKSYSTNYASEQPTRSASAARTPTAARASTPAAARASTPAAARNSTPAAARASTPAAARTSTPTAARTSTPTAARTSTVRSTSEGLTPEQYTQALNSGIIPGNASANDRANLRATMKAIRDTKSSQLGQRSTTTVKSTDPNTAYRARNRNPWASQNMAEGGATKKPVKKAAKKPAKKFAKGGSIDGCAIRGKTRAMRKK